jgi:hypothetical protein
LQTQATEMSLDSFTGVCQSGDTLQGAISNSTVTFQRLLGIGTIERGEAHADARFAEQVNIGGSTSSAANFMWLVAAEGSEHRGVAGAGVIIDPPNMPTNNSHAVMIRDDFVRVEGLEITDWFRGTSTSRGIFVDGARDVLIQHMLIHDDGDGENGSGIDGVFGGNSDGMGPASRFTVANSVIYRVSQSAIRASNMSSVRLVNVTAYECGLATHTSEIGCIDSDNQPVTEAVNVVSLVGPNSVGNVEAFDGAFIANSSHNLSSDTSAPGTDEIHGVDPESLFANPGQADLRLGDPDSAAGANLCDTDPELSVTIEGQARPMNGPWPRGAY